MQREFTHIMLSLRVEPESFNTHGMTVLGCGLYDFAGCHVDMSVTRDCVVDRRRSAAGQRIEEGSGALSTMIWLAGSMLRLLL